MVGFEGKWQSQGGGIPAAPLMAVCEPQGMLGPPDGHMASLSL